MRMSTPATSIVTLKIVADGWVITECGGSVPPRSLISCRVEKWRHTGYFISAVRMPISRQNPAHE